MEPVIQFENVSKLYHLGSPRTHLRNLFPKFMWPQHSEKPWLDADSAVKNEFWALKDISFAVYPGEVLGIIGRNGAGKTTALSLLAGITKPTLGDIKVKGRIGALIKLGAGFHPDLSGRENVYLNASILGLKKSYVDKVYDDIVEFSELAQFMETPVKRYSSGMYVRLGFAVAVHIKPDILLVDEVLAVGDLSFRAKCRKRIREMVEEGVSIILVSHNMHAISHLCDRTIVLEHGQIAYSGNTTTAIEHYRSSMTIEKAEPRRVGSGEVKITKLETFNEQELPQEAFQISDLLIFRLHYHAETAVQDPVFNIAIYELDGIQVTGLRSDVDDLQLGVVQGEGYLDIQIDQINLLPNTYTIAATIFEKEGFAFIDRVVDIGQIKVLGGHQVNGTVFLPHSWQHHQADGS